VLGSFIPFHRNVGALARFSGNFATLDAAGYLPVKSPVEKTRKACERAFILEDADRKNIEFSVEKSFAGVKLESGRLRNPFPRASKERQKTVNYDPTAGSRSPSR
jgi:hypothetical protein